jgi:uncharacterized membrane protein
VLTAIVILANVLGNFSMSWGLKRRAMPLGDSPLDYLRAFLDPWVLAGVALLVLWLLARMALLSWADLSYVLPVTAFGYVLTAVMGKVFLAEHVSATRWLGTLLIFGGVALVGATSVSTTAEPERARDEEVAVP